MGAVSWRRGYEVEWNETASEWCYRDTGDVADYDRPCIKCEEMPTQEGYDACLGHVEGVISACCGHGVWEGAIMYDDALEEGG